MTGRTVLVVGYGYVFADPTSRHTCERLQSDGWSVAVLQSDIGRSLPHVAVPGVAAVDSPAPSLPGPLRRLNGPLKAWHFRRNAARIIRQKRPSLVVTITLNDLASLPWPPEKCGYKLVSAVLDVPVMQDAGRYDRVLLRRAWERLGRADVLWASDRCKAELAMRFGRLREMPLVCHNAPQNDYLPEPTWPRDGWLRAELRKQGASLGETGGCIVLRTGAVGDYGGIGETLAALRELPADVVFLMTGRPDAAYRQSVTRAIASAGLERRAFLWDRPSDEAWKKALAGADVGHLIHGPFPSGRWQRLYDANSSLSNYRVFHYFAAGLPALGYDDPRMADLYAEVPAFRVCRHAHLTADLRAHIAELAAAPAVRERLGRAGRAAHLATYNWVTQFAPVVARIRQLTDAGAASAVAAAHP